MLGVAREDAADEARDGARLKIIRLVSYQVYYRYRVITVTRVASNIRVIRASRVMSVIRLIRVVRVIKVTKVGISMVIRVN